MIGKYFADARSHAFFWAAWTENKAASQVQATRCREPA